MTNSSGLELVGFGVFETLNASVAKIKGTCAQQTLGDNRHDLGNIQHNAEKIHRGLGNTHIMILAIACDRTHHAHSSRVLRTWVAMRLRSTPPIKAPAKPPTAGRSSQSCVAPQQK